jgi:hypothetical protein
MNHTRKTWYSIFPYLPESEYKPHESYVKFLDYLDKVTTQWQEGKISSAGRTLRLCYVNSVDPEKKKQHYETFSLPELARIKYRKV